MNHQYVNNDKAQMKREKKGDQRNKKPFFFFFVINKESEVFVRFRLMRLPCFQMLEVKRKCDYATFDSIVVL